MKKNALFLLLLIVATTMSSQTLLNGDLNHDGVIDIADVTALVNVTVGKSQAEVINVAPVVPDPHEYVDLGLPSGTLWATCNVGAENPEDYGDYFAWGETKPKDAYLWSNYQHCKGSYETITKYCNYSYFGYNDFTDDLTELELNDDAAYVNWGTNWRMPTKEQQDELWMECTSNWTTRNGVDGREVIGPNGNSLFLPATGYRDGTTYFASGSVCYLWSRTLESGPNGSALYSALSRVEFYVTYMQRCLGLPIRPVRAS